MAGRALYRSLSHKVPHITRSGGRMTKQYFKNGGYWSARRDFNRFKPTGVTQFRGTTVSKPKSDLIKTTKLIYWNKYHCNINLLAKVWLTIVFFILDMFLLNKFHEDLGNEHNNLIMYTFFLYSRSRNDDAFIWLDRRRCNLLIWNILVMNGRIPL